MCFGRNEDADYHFFLLSDGSVCTLDTAHRERDLSTPESAIEFLARLEFDVFASQAAVNPSEGRLYRTFNGGVVLAISEETMLLLAGGYGPLGNFGRLSPGDSYTVWAPGGFFLARIGGENSQCLEELLLSNALSLKEELAADLPEISVVPFAPSFPGETLYPDVLSHVYRLGGTVSPPAVNPVPWSGGPVPEPLRRFLVDVRWPKRRAFANGDSDHLRVWNFRPAPSTFDPEPYAFLREHPGAICLGLADGGNYFLFILPDDPAPTDPDVFKLDHDEYDAFVGSERLTQFLASLWPDVRANRGSVRPETGRFFRTANGGIALVRGCDEQGAEVVVVRRGNGEPCDGDSAGQKFRVGRDGLYVGVLESKLRLRLSLIELLPFDLAGT